MASDGETSCANDPNFAVIYSFLKVFGKLYGLGVPTIAKLQEFVENTQEVSETLKDLHLRLLRRALKTVHSNRWEKGMIKFCHQQGHHQEAWEIERFSYKKASTQVKLKVLKILLEYQFTCHPKFKTAVNAISCKELRLDPIGRDQNGCAYWLQIDDDANICLYKEDQDEETWQLIARNREELVKVIGQLKNGEEICASQSPNANEDSSGAENPSQESQLNPQPQPQNLKIEEENDEEFLSPESESDQEIEPNGKDQQSSDPLDGNETNIESSDSLDNNDTKLESSDSLDNNEQIEENETVNKNTKETSEKQSDITTETQSDNTTETQVENYTEKEREDRETSPSICDNQDDNILETNQNVSEKQTEDIIEANENVTVTQNENISGTIEKEKVIETEKNNIEPELEKKSQETPNSPKASESSKDSESILENNEDSIVGEDSKGEELKVQNEEVSESIEEPVLLVTGEGNGVDCESYFIGEEISEPVMYFYGEGCGYDNDTGNPEAIQETNQAKKEEENENEDIINGEHEVVKTKGKLNKSVRLKTVNKRSLKKQSNEPNDAKPDTKKPCVRDIEKSHNSRTENDLKREAGGNDKSTTENESPRKNNVKKGRSKVKKKAVAKKIKRNGGKEAINSVSEIDNCQDKTSIIEKRKSSVSSVDQDDGSTENEKEKTPDKELKMEDPLPTKKLRLETTPESDVNTTHSKDAVSDSIENKDNSNHNFISKRKKIKASKGKFKRKKTVQNKQDSDKSNDVDKINDCPKKGNKSLKRSLIEDPTSDKNKSESQSESEDDEPITSGKRLKIKPKKIITSSRKKVEAKLLEKHSSDESEEETLYSLAGKKSTKKLVKKKPKGKSKDKKLKARMDKPNSEDSDTAPVRQSRRIAQQKIKEEADRRHQEEVALRELKMIHKKKSKDDEEEEEWRASGRSSSEADTKRKQAHPWHASDSTGPEPDSESDSPLFELQPEPEPEHDYGKSDHEFSPESDLESGETVEPLKRARTLQEEKDDGFCKRCGSAEQPEWILLCDKCDAGYHASCLKPMLFVVPEGDWFCPPCNHDKLIEALESELVKYDELLAKVEEERARKKLEEPEPEVEEKRPKSDAESEGTSDSSWSSSSGGAAVYRLRARRQLPVSYRSQEYDRIISAAIKEEYVEPTTSAGNQGRGKDISTIIEAAEEEKMKAEREAIEQGKPVEMSKKLRKKQRRKPRKLNSLEVPSEDDDETDEDFKDTGAASSSEDISSSADKESSDSRSSDSLPIRRTGRTDKKDRPKMTESSPETKKKKGIFQDSSSESAGAKEWNASSKSKSKSHSRSKKRDRRDKSRKSKKSRGLTQYDADGNVTRARVTYGGLSGAEGDNDWSPKHRTRQKKINYTEMPNTESEDEMHKSSGKHMPDSSDEFKCSDSEFETDSDSDRTKKRKEEENLEREKALSDLVKKTAVVPLEKLPEDVTKAKTEELQAHLNAQQADAKPVRGKGSRGGRGSRGPRGRGGRGSGARAGSPQTDEALAKLVGVKIKELGQDGTPVKPNQLEREKKRQEREAKQAEKEAKKLERIQKKEEKEKLKEQKAKEREEKRLARLALQESKRIKKEKEYMGPMGGYGVPIRPLGAESPRNNMTMNMFNHMRPPRPAGPGGPGPPGPGGPPDAPDQRFPNTPRLQVRAELRGVLTGEDRHMQHRAEHQHNALREGTLSVAGSPQPFKPVSEEPSIITRMPHMLNQQYRGPMMYPGGGGGGGYGARQQGVYGLHGALPRYPPHYYRLPPAYPAPAATPPAQQQVQGLYRPHMQGPGGPPTSMHHNQGPSLHHSGGYYRAAPPGTMPPGQGTHNTPGASPSHAPPPGGSPMGVPGHAMSGPHLNSGPMGGPSHNVSGGPFLNRSPGPNPSPSSSIAPSLPGTPGAPLTSTPGALGAPGAPPMSSGPSRLFGAAPGAPPMSAALQGAPGAPGAPGLQPLGGHDHEPPIRIKAEVKTEPEYRSPVASPGAASPGEAREEPPRHPKMKVTEVRERRPRFPLGPYAPHLTPYRPYAPPPHHAAPPPHHAAPPPHHAAPPPHHAAPPPHHAAPPPHHAAPPPHHLQHRDSAQLMAERVRSPAPAGGEGAGRPFPPHHLPRPPYAAGSARMPPPHAPPYAHPRLPHPHSNSPHPAHSHSPHAGHSQSPHAGHPQSMHAGHPQSPLAGHPQSPLAQHSQTPHAGHPQSPHAGHSQSPHAGHSQASHAGLLQSPLAGHPQSPLAGHSQPPHAGHPQSPHAGHTQSPHAGHSQAPHVVHPQSPHTGHPQSPHAGHSQAPHAVHPQAPHTGHPQSPHAGHPQAPHVVHPHSPHAGHPQSPQAGHSQSPHTVHSQPPRPKSPLALPPQTPHAQPKPPPPGHAAPGRVSMPFLPTVPPHLQPPAHPQSPAHFQQGLISAPQRAPPPGEPLHNAPLHQPYAPRLPLRPQSPHKLHMPPSPHRAPAALLPPARTPPPAHSPPAERASPPTLSYPPYVERRAAVALPQPIPRASLPAGSPRRRLEALDARGGSASPDAPQSPPPLDRVKIEREEGGEFGGLVSYFSSQHEDDMDG